MVKPLVALLFISTSVLGQDILSNETKKLGLYSDFTEFRTNSPSIEGEIKFVTNKRGRVQSLIINGDSIRNRDMMKNYWGFCKDSLIYLNALREWPKADQNLIPDKPYYPLKLGFYSYCVVEVTNTNAAIMGGVAGGIVGGLIAAGVSTTLGNKKILTVNHQTGAVKIAKKTNIQFLFMDEDDIVREYENNPNRDKDDSLILNFIDKYNSRKEKKNDINFNQKEFWPTMIVARKPKKQTQKEIDIYINDVHIDAISDMEFFKEKIPYDSEIKIAFKIGKSILSEEITIEVEPKERIYFIISNSTKSPNQIVVKKSDATQTGYIINGLN
ncbi:MAG: hypothetical protein AB8B73_07640 [Ekhidna sp.]